MVSCQINNRKKEAVVEESRIMDPSLFESLKAETPEIAKIDFEAPVEETKPTEDKKKICC